MSNKLTNILTRAIIDKYVETLKNSILGKKWEYKVEEDYADHIENSWDSEGKNNFRVKLYIKRVRERASGQENYKFKTRNLTEDYRLMTIAFEESRVRSWASNKRENCLYCYSWDKNRIDRDYPAFFKYAWTVFLLMFKNLPEKSKVIRTPSGEVNLFDLQLLLPIFLTIDQLAEPETLSELI